MDIFNLTEEQQELADKLNAKQLTFANLWLTANQHGMSNMECYRQAGYTAKNDNVAAVQANRLLKNAKIWAYCQAMRAESIEETGLTLRYLDQQLKDLIDGTSTEVMTTVAHITDRIDEETGEPIVVHVPAIRCAIDDLPPEVQGSIQSMKTTANGVEVKQYSRLEALKLAYQRQGALKEGRELTGPNGSPLAAPMFEYRIVGGPGEEPPMPKQPEE